VKPVILSCKDVSVTLGTLEVLRSVTLDIAPGEIVTIMGPSGSGKSTLLRVLAGLVVPSQGVIHVGSRRVEGPSPLLRYAFQDYDSFPWLSVKRNISIAMGSLNQSYTDELLREVGLESFAAYSPRALSGGMRKRLGLARALSSKPRVILLDEPFGSLDVVGRAELHDLVHKMTKQYTCAFLIVTHDIDEAVYLSHRIVIGSRLPFRLVETVTCTQAAIPRSPDFRRSPEFEATTMRVRQLLAESRD